MGIAPRGCGPTASEIGDGVKGHVIEIPAPSGEVGKVPRKAVLVVGLSEVTQEEMSR